MLPKKYKPKFKLLLRPVLFSRNKLRCFGTDVALPTGRDPSAERKTSALLRTGRLQVINQKVWPCPRGSGGPVQSTSVKKENTAMRCQAHCFHPYCTPVALHSTPSPGTPCLVRAVRLMQSRIFERKDPMKSSTFGAPKLEKGN